MFATFVPDIPENTDDNVDGVPERVTVSISPKLPTVATVIVKSLAGVEPPRALPSIKKVCPI